MTVIISGSSGITSVNGTAAAPSVTGTDTDTGIVYGTNTLSLATGGVNGLTVDSSQNVSILGALSFGSFSGGLGKVGSFSRSVSGATGTVSYTGVGFKPSIVIFLATVDTVSAQSIGFTSATAGRCLYIDNVYSSGGGSYSEAIHLVRTVAGNGALQTAVISTMDSDGFTLSWTKTDLGSGGSGNSIAVSYLAFK